jgi:hypothetical protein
MLMLPPLGSRPEKNVSEILEGPPPCKSPFYVSMPAVLRIFLVGIPRTGYESGIPRTGTCGMLASDAMVSEDQVHGS